MWNTFFFALGAMKMLVLVINPLVGEGNKGK